MSSEYQTVEQDAPYFLTFQVVKWVDVFTEKPELFFYPDAGRACAKRW
jgi:hypothetical protein